MALMDYDRHGSRAECLWVEARADFGATIFEQANERGASVLSPHGNLVELAGISAPSKACTKSSLACGLLQLSTRESTGCMRPVSHANEFYIGRQFRSGQSTPRINNDQ